MRLSVLISIAALCLLTGLVISDIACNSKSVQVVATSVKDCAKAEIASVVVKIVPAVRAVLAAAPEDRWQAALDALGSLMQNGVAVITCAVAEIYESGLSELKSTGNAKASASTTLILGRASSYLVAAGFTKAQTAQ